MPDIPDRVPSPDGKVFLSADNHAATGDWGPGTGGSNPNPKHLAPNPCCFTPVIHEESTKIAGATKAPDYTFRIGGRRVFFAEAKKPAVRIAEDSSPAFQLRRYAWTSKLPVSLLTDFEQFAVYDCRTRPVRTDKASTARTDL